MRGRERVACARSLAQLQHSAYLAARRSALVVTILIVSACGSGDSAAETTAPPATNTTPPNTGAPAVESVTNQTGQAAPEQLAGTWWVFVPEQPQRAFRATLVATDHEQHFRGSWVSFDWRGTSRPETLHRMTKPVEIQAEHSDGRLFVRGPAPQIDATSGQPTGAHGSWELRVRLASLPGEPLRFTGRLLRHDDSAEDEGLAAEVSKSFEAYSG
ncbi:MAG: hypothetical protein DHS20C15_08130 [Planctomycetota bacterium]|nr:MAG: hypothetical protein DHS20C15_08130 [Planctomycetota bacterium]